MKLTFFFSTLSLSLSQGGATNAHLGNVRYRALVQAHQNEYLHAEKTKKKEVARSIVSIIRSRGGRILKKCNDGRVGWTDIGDTKAREKTSQGLREGLDVLRKNEEAAVAGAKRKARDDDADDGDDNKKKAAESSSTAATAPDATTVATDDDIAAAAEAAILAAPIRAANRTSLTLAETALAGDPANTASTPGAATATATAPELVAESAPTYTNVPVPAPAPSYFDYSASYALSASAGTTTSGVSASAFNYPGTGYGYPYPYPHPFPGYHPPAGNGYGQYGLSYEANLYATAAASFGIPAPPVTTSVDDGDAEEGKEEEEIFGETAQI